MLVFLFANILSRFLPSSSISLPSSLLLSSSVDRTSVDDKTLNRKKEKQLATVLFAHNNSTQEKNTFTLKQY